MKYLFLLSALICALFPTHTQGAVSVIETPILIDTCLSLQNQINLNPRASFKLAGDIDCLASKQWNNGQGFLPLTNLDTGASEAFSGTLDGAGFSINNLFINTDRIRSTGLFAYTNNAVIKNLTLKNINYKSIDMDGFLPSDLWRMGAIASQAQGGVFENITVDGVLFNEVGISGGLIGEQRTGTDPQTTMINNCHVTVTINGNGNMAGGLLGRVKGHVDIAESSARGKILNLRIIGGLVGAVPALARVSITNSYSRNDLATQGTAGGLIGFADAVQIQNTYTVNRVFKYASPLLSRLGGLIGDSGNPAGIVISNSFWDKQISNVLTSIGSADHMGRTSGQLKQRSNFPGGTDGFNFNTVWGIFENADFPYLRKEAYLKLDKITPAGFVPYQDTILAMDGDYAIIKTGTAALGRQIFVINQHTQAKERYVFPQVSSIAVAQDKLYYSDSAQIYMKAASSQLNPVQIPLNSRYAFNQKKRFNPKAYGQFVLYTSKSSREPYYDLVRLDSRFIIEQPGNIIARSFGPFTSYAMSDSFVAYATAGSVFLWDQSRRVNRKIGLGTETALDQRKVVYLGSDNRIYYYDTASQRSIPQIDTTVRKKNLLIGGEWVLWAQIDASYNRWELWGQYLPTRQILRLTEKVAVNGQFSLADSRLLFSDGRDIYLMDLKFNRKMINLKIDPHGNAPGAVVSLPVGLNCFLNQESIPTINSNQSVCDIRLEQGRKIELRFLPGRGARVDAFYEQSIYNNYPLDSENELLCGQRSGFSAVRPDAANKICYRMNVDQEMTLVYDWKGRIAGSVLANGQPWANKVVYLSLEGDTAVINSALTDNDGVYQISNDIRPGRVYRVWLTRNDTVADGIEERAVFISETSPTVNGVNFDLNVPQEWVEKTKGIRRR